jgi:threonylcarbamoyladenosine tRNA methylthiotransferase MtaB
MGILMKKFAILTLGCRVNHYESQVLSEELTRLGYENAPFSDKCDVYIVNSCAVTEESVRKSKQMVRRALKTNPDAFIAVCGCASQLHPSDFEAIKGISFIYGTRNKEAVIDALKAHISGENFPHTIVTEPSSDLSPTAITRFDRTRAYVKIQDGCENKCAYCIIPRVRGTVVVRDENEIINEVKALAESTCHEVVLTGIETSAYGNGLPMLIKKISQIEGIERIRLGSLEPSFMKPEFIDSIADIKQVCHHFHISIQNGSDNVLRVMRRRYNVKMLVDNMSYLRSVMPDVNLSADIIVGFPGETEEDFDQTCSLVKTLNLLHVHAFTYSKRPNTEAAKMENQISEAVKTARLHRLQEIAYGCKKAILDQLISSGDNVLVLIETINKGYLTGHTDNFIECKIPISEGIEPSLLKGTLISVKPKEISDEYLICSL